MRSTSKVSVEFGDGTGRASAPSREVRVNISTQPELLEQIRRKIVNREGFAVATLNLDHINRLMDDDNFYAAYTSHEFITADGFPVALVGRLKTGKWEQVTGADLVRPLVRQAADLDCPVAIVGSVPSSVATAASVLEQENPGLRVVHQECPQFSYWPTEQEFRPVLQRVEESGARLCFLAFGAPKQEIIAAAGRSITPGVGFISVGAAIDFISGHQRRAPAIMRRLRMEWLWRLTANPRRLGKRYMQCIMILPAFAVGALVGRSK